MTEQAYAQTGNGRDIVMAATEEAVRFRTAIACNDGTPVMCRLARALLVAEHGQPVDVSRCLQLYEEAREEDGSMVGMCYLGYYFENGIGGIPRCATRARWFFEKDITCNDCHLARYALAESLSENDEAPKDAVRALKLYEEVLEKARFNLVARKLAALIDQGATGVPRDPKRAIDLYLWAIEYGGSTEAMFSLGRLYTDGREGVPPQPAKAVQLYERAIEEGEHSNAMNSLALLLQDGAEGVAMDVHRAVQLFERAIEKDDNMYAMNNLAFLISEGYVGVPRDMTRVVQLYDQAIARGNQVSARNMARLLQKGDDDVPVDKVRALQLFELLVDDQEMFNTVRFEVALLISCGEKGVPQDTVRAARIYEAIISEESNIAAMFNLACMLSEGRGNLKQDNARAVALYERAIVEGDDVLSMVNLGIMLGCENDGIEKDKDRAVALLEKAIEKGRKEAKYFLARVLAGFDGEPIDPGRSVVLFEEIVEELQHVGAMNGLAVLLDQGLHGVTKDVETAVALSELGIVVGLEHNAEELEKLGIVTNPDYELNSDEDSVKARKHDISIGSHFVSMLNLAELLLSGKVVMDVERAVRLCSRALTDPEAEEVCRYIELDDLLRETENMSKNIGLIGDNMAAAVRICELVIGATRYNPASCGHAMRLLASILLEGSAVVPRDVQRALNLYREAVERGDKKAALYLGDVMFYGVQGVEIDERQAFDLYARVLSSPCSSDVSQEATVKLALLCQGNIMRPFTDVTAAELLQRTERNKFGLVARRKFQQCPDLPLASPLSQLIAKCIRLSAAAFWEFWAAIL